MNEIIEKIISILCVYIFVNFLFNIINYNIFKFAMKKRMQSGNSNWKKAAKAFGIKVSKLKKMSKDEIKKMYRDLAKKHHPDVGGNTDKFRDLHEAYEFASASI